MQMQEILIFVRSKYLKNSIVTLFFCIWFITVKPHLSRLFTYPDTCLELIMIIYIESDSHIRIFSYTYSQLGKRDLQISEGLHCIIPFNIFQVISGWCLLVSDGKKTT